MIQFNLNYLKNKLNYSLNIDTSNYTINNIKELLKEKFEQTDFSLIKNDIIPFVDAGYNTDIFDKEKFIKSLEYLEAE